VGTGIKDPLKNLVYRVHPLPESMIDAVFDFGALSPENEKLYIKAMLHRALAEFVRQVPPTFPPLRSFLPLPPSVFFSQYSFL
jgi:hypothetical protein